MLIRYTASGWNSGPVTGAGIGGGALVGFESMISTVVPGWLAGAGETNTSVRARRRSSPGNLRLSALKWFDILVFLLGSGADWVGRQLRIVATQGPGAGRFRLH